MSLKLKYVVQTGGHFVKWHIVESAIWTYHQKCDHFVKNLIKNYFVESQKVDQKSASCQNYLWHWIYLWHFFPIGKFFQFYDEVII
jgi:hypothetical protein